MGRTAEDRSSSDDVTVAVGSDGIAGGAKAQLREGDVVDRYRIRGLLGTGGMGTVYLAFDPELDRDVALKVLDPNPRDRDASGRARMLREAQAMARLNHPNVVPIYAAGTHEGRVFIAMEPVQGQTVREWLARPHSLDEILDVFLEAAKGLVVAHEAELIHRDFKPANVLVGDDGRVRVMDFGLARIPERGSTPGSTEVTDDDSEITKAGIVMGTPRYMAPEQHAGRPATPAVDQYAWCVSVWTALLGHPPFSGPDLVVEKLAGPPRVATQGVPRRVIDVLARGLAADPLRRWPSVEAMANAMRRAASPRRTLRWVGAGIVVVGVGAWLGLRPRTDASPCETADERLAGVWDEAARTRTTAALSDGSATYAADTARFVADRLDDYARQWGEDFGEACRKAMSDEPEAEQIADLQIRCLDVRREALAGLVGALETGGNEIAGRAADAVMGLPAVAECTDVESLRRAVQPPADPTVAARVDRLQELMARASTVAAIDADAAEAQQLLARVMREAASIEYAPLQGQVLQLRAEVAALGGEVDRAIDLHKQAFEAAIEAGDDATAANAAADLVYLTGYRSGRPDDARPWLRELEARTQRLGATAPLANRLRETEIPLAQVTRDFDRAEALGRESLAYVEERFGPDDPRVARVQMNLGASLFSLERYEEARESFERARRIFEATRGTDHPVVGQVLTSLGNATWMLGDKEAAIELFRRSVAIGEATQGGDHIELAVPLMNLAVAESRSGHHEEGIRDMGRALAIQRAALGSDSMVLAHSENAFASILFDAERYEDARAHNERALELVQRVAGNDHVEADEAHRGLAASLVKLGRPDDAAIHLRECAQADRPDQADACKTGLAQLAAGGG